MGWFDGFPFKSKEETARREREYLQRVLPLGEAQKQAALALLRQLAPGVRDEELLFCYLTAKDTLSLYGAEAEGQHKALAAMPGYMPLNEAQRHRVLALALLDFTRPTLEPYPDLAAVEETAERLFV